MSVAPKAKTVARKAKKVAAKVPGPSSNPATNLLILDIAMERQGDEAHFETDEARGASSPNIVRWILIVSLFAAIALLSIIWITGAATQGEDESSVKVDALGGERTAESTDSIVGEDADQLDTAEPADDAATPSTDTDAASEPTPTPSAT